jgi:uncharacterized protein (DUF1786 family)
MVMPSATKIAEARIRAATLDARPLVLTGVIQGGGPCHWALEDHLKASHPAYATPDAAQTFDDDLDKVAAMGITVVSEDEAQSLVSGTDASTRGASAPPNATAATNASREAQHVNLQDLDLPAIRTALAAFGVAPDFDGLALACLDHGAAPPGYSDRLFRFDHLRRVVKERNDLRNFAMLPDDIPDYLTRARQMVATAREQDGAADTPIVFLDTGPAAALGALQDDRVAASVAADETQLVLNLGNMHALAFHLKGTEIIALYEHHTGEITAAQIEDFTQRLITADLKHEEVFGSKGHGVFYAETTTARKDRSSDLSARRPALVAVTGPQRSKIRGSTLNPYFATPHGDMMISGCFGLLTAFAEKYPQHREEIERSLEVTGDR